jgi:hypothetical protein
MAMSNDLTMISPHRDPPGGEQKGEGESQARPGARALPERLRPSSLGLRTSRAAPKGCADPPHGIRTPPPRFRGDPGEGAPNVPGKGGGLEGES